MIELKVFNEKANELAEELIPYGETNYNLWYVKKMCFLANSTTFEHEIEFSEKTLFEKVKNFQLWEHRRFLLEHKNDPVWYHKEYELIDQILEKEPKNYHAWSQRVWILDQLKNFTEELVFTDAELKKDILNNSVWAYRSYVVRGLIKPPKDDKEKVDFLEKEVKNCFDIINLNPNNIAAWNYLRGWLPSIKLSDIPSKNDYLTKAIVSEQIYTLILEFTKAKLTEMNEEASKKHHHHRVEEEIQLLTTLVTIYSQKKENKEFAKNVPNLFNFLECSPSYLERKTKEKLLEMGCPSFMISNYHIFLSSFSLFRTYFYAIKLLSDEISEISVSYKNS